MALITLTSDFGEGSQYVAALKARLLAAHAVTTIHDLIRKEHGSEAARRSLRSILRVFSVATIDEAVVEDAMHLSQADFEDAVSEAAARHARCDLIVTRDPSGFVGSHVRVLPPEAAAALLTR